MILFSLFFLLFPFLIFKGVLGYIDSITKHSSPNQEHSLNMRRTFNPDFALKNKTKHENKLNILAALKENKKLFLIDFSIQKLSLSFSKAKVSLIRDKNINSNNNDNSNNNYYNDNNNNDDDSNNNNNSNNSYNNNNNNNNNDNNNNNNNNNDYNNSNNDNNSNNNNNNNNDYNYNDNKATPYNTRKTETKNQIFVS